MKREAVRHWKIADLARRLEIPHLYAVGIMEALWNLCAEHTHMGDIGRMPNHAIAQQIQWEGDPDALVAALLDCRLLDHDSTHRLVVHDWHEHATDTVKRRAQRGGGELIIADGHDASTASHDRSMTSHDASRSDASEKSPLWGREGGDRSCPVTDQSRPVNDASCPATRPNQTSPDLTRPNQTTHPPDDDADGELRVEPDHEHAPTGSGFALSGDPPDKRRRRGRVSAETVIAIYAAYPRKVGKGDAAKAISRAVARLVADGGRGFASPDEAAAWLLERVQAYAASGFVVAKRASDEMQHVPHPATWMNHDRFDDDPAEWKAPSSAQAAGGVQEPQSGGAISELLGERA